MEVHQTEMTVKLLINHFLVMFLFLLTHSESIYLLKEFLDILLSWMSSLVSQVQGRPTLTFLAQRLHCF